MITHLPIPLQSFLKSVCIVYTFCFFSISVTVAQRPFHKITQDFSNSILKNGIVNYKNGNYKEALTFFSNKQLESSFSKEEKEVALLFKAQSLTQLNEPTQAIHLLKQISPQSRFYFNSNYQLGRIHIALANLDSVYQYANRCIKLSPASSEAYSLMKEYHQLNYQFDKALVNAQKELTLAEKANDIVLIAGALCDVGTVWIGMNEYDKALDYFNKALNIQKSNANYESIFVTFLGLIDANREKGNLEKSLSLIEDTYQYKAYFNTNRIGELLLRKAFTLSLLERFEQAEKTYYEALPFFEKSEKKALIANTYILLGRQQLDLKAYMDAEKNLLKGLAKAKEGNINSMRENATILLTDLYEEMGDYKKALKFHKDFKAFEDSTFSIEKETIVREAAEKYESEKKSAENKLLQSENKRTKQKQQTLIYTLVGLSVFILLILFLLFSVRNLNRQLKKAVEEIKQQSESKEKLFTIIAHDIRRPFHAYQGMNEMIKYLLQKNDYKGIEALSLAIDESGVKVRNLLDNLLSWALTETQEMPYHPENVLVKPLIDEIVEIYETLNLYKKVTFRIECDATLTAYIDKNGLSLILRNLIENSFKALMPGGLIEIKVKEISTEKIIITIEDNAGGLKEEKLAIVKKIFENPQKAFIGQDGVGIGIVLISKFTYINKGRVSAKSLNDGSIFEIELPRIIIPE